MILFIGVSIVMIANEWYWFMLVPFMVILIWTIIYQPDKALLFIAFFTPLSIKINFSLFGVSMNLPTEPVLVILLGLFFLKLIIDGRYDRAALKHPLTMVIIFNLAWILITACASSMPFVSIKFFIARLWFVTSFYFLAGAAFMNFKNFKRYIWLFSTSLVAVILYSLTRHFENNWEQLYANYAPNPFFAGHGDYAAAISLFIPFIAIFIIKPKVYKITTVQRSFLIAFLTILIIGLIMSFTRAAWIGIAVALVSLFIFIFRPRRVTVALILFAGLGILYANKDDIYHKLRTNKKVSASNLKQHVESISNISTDVSNTERINRWHSAFRMFEVHPVFGWGPGTYMFQYAPFQVSSEMTIISTNTGNLGNSHSEYIGPLAEEGIIGSLSFISILIVSLTTGIRLIYRGTTSFVRNTAGATILALITYYVHGTINNYLDTDKAAIPFFACMAILLALDIHYDKLKKDNTIQETQVIE
jgi:putative inorganic carbon (HCO3(-)) transporter